MINLGYPFTGYHKILLYEKTEDLKPKGSLKINPFKGALKPTCLFTRLEESSLVPAEFLTAQFL
jgi:hypothetical protein